jgi:hypothetical protein
LAELREQMRELISTAQTVAETVVMTGYPFDEQRTSPYMNTVSYYLLRDAEAYTKQLVTVAKECDASVLDYFSALRNRHMHSLLGSDGLHGNPEYHELLFTITRDYIRDVYK